QRPGGHGAGAVPPRGAPHRPLLVAGFDVVVLRGHPDDLDEAAQRDRLDAVLGLALLERPQRRAEADEVPGHLHAEGLRRAHVTGLMEADGDQNADGEDDDPDGLHWSPSALPTVAITS